MTYQLRHFAVLGNSRPFKPLLNSTVYQPVSQQDFGVNSHGFIFIVHSYERILTIYFFNDDCIIQMQNYRGIMSCFWLTQSQIHLPNHQKWTVSNSKSIQRILMPFFLLSFLTQKHNIFEIWFLHNQYLLMGFSMNFNIKCDCTNIPFFLPPKMLCGSNLGNNLFFRQLTVWIYGSISFDIHSLNI